MFSLLQNYMDNISLEQVNNYALKNNIILSNEELDFTYKFVKKNWQTIFANHGNFDISRYKNYFSEENYNKIVKLYKESLQKYSNYL
jgi:hypothetical protein